MLTGGVSPLAYVRLVLRLLFVVALSLALPSLVVSIMETVVVAKQAESDYERALTEFRESEARLRAVEERLVLLSSNVSAVEDEVRRQLRMIRPGEELYLIERSEGLVPSR
jgi:cell division protein FtsB